MLLKRFIGYGLVVALGVLFFVQLKQLVIDASKAESKVCYGLMPEKLDVKAPGFKLADLDGRKRSLADYRGRVVLLHFWFTRCRPCIQELPSLSALNKSMSGRDFQIVTVSVDEKLSELKSFVGRYGLARLPILHDAKKSVPRRYGTQKYPESYLIDRDGIVRYRFVNKRAWSTELARSCVRSML